MIHREDGTLYESGEARGAEDDEFSTGDTKRREPCDESLVRDAVLEVLTSHTRILSELLPARIDETVGDTDPIPFLRDYVATGRPLVVRQERHVASWPARSLWQDQEYLNRKLRDVEVTVALTPDGLADAVSQSAPGVFMLPAEERMPYTRFVRLLERQDPVVYLQKQNNSFLEEFSALWQDVGRIPWADAAFSAADVDATNFWQGRAPTKTSWHRDPYENIYVVLRGTKRVRLLPMTDTYRLQVKDYPQAVWRYEENGAPTFRIHHLPERGTVPWSSLAPCKCRGESRCRSCRHLAEPMPKECLLRAGDVLFIPAFTYHELCHEDINGAPSTIAINFWYETRYNSNHGFATTQAFDRLAKLV